MGNISSKHDDQFYSQYPLEHISQGAVILSPKDDLTSAFYLESGKICKYDVTKFGEKVVMNVFNVPVLLPLTWLLNTTPNRYYFEAQTPVTIRRIPKDAASAHLQANPEIMYGMLQVVYLGIETTQRRVAQLMRGSMRSRILFEILIEAQRGGTLQDDGSTIMTIGEVELANRAGLSRESVSRELSKLFKTRNVCWRQGRSIVVRNVNELDNMLQIIR